MDSKRISTSELKSRCAKIIRDMSRGRTPVTITRRGRAVARLVPVDDERGTLFGFAKGNIKVRGDIMGPIDVDWEAGT